MTDGIIRNVRREDAAQIAEIYRHYVENTTVSFETEPLTLKDMSERIESISAHYPFIVYEDNNGKIMGYSYVHPWKGYAAYAGTLETTIYLHPTACGKGVGRKLMDKLIEQCRTNKYHTLIACVTAENDGSVRFHRSLGFEQVSYFREVGYKFGRRLDVIDLQLIL